MINTTMSASEKLQNQLKVDTFNKSIAIKGRQSTQELGKDDFLKLLVSQLQNQDPSNPMENTDFIAQMAQFSSLEQISNMSNSFTKLSTMLTGTEAVSTIGKRVDVLSGEEFVSGTVEAATRGKNPQVKVNGAFYNMEKVKRVYGN